MNTELETDALDLVMDVAGGVAHRLHHRFGDFVEFDDLYQEAVTWAIENPKKVHNILDLSDDSTDTDEGRHKRNLLFRYMCSAAERQAREAKAHMSGYYYSDENFYTTNMIEALIPWYYEVKGDAQGPRYQHGGSGSQESFESDDGRAMAADMGLALEQLTEDQRNAVWVSYVSGEEGKMEAAERLGLNYRNISRDAKRAVSKMSAYLGGPNPWGDELYDEPVTQETYQRTGEGKPNTVDIPEGRERTDGPDV